MKIKQIFWGDIEGKFKEVDNQVTIVWGDGEILEMQSDLFYNDWLPRVKKKLRIISD